MMSAKIFSNGSIRLRVGGLNRSLILKKLSAKGIIFKNVFDDGNSLVFSINKKDLKTVKKFCGLVKLDVKVLSVSGFNAFCINVLKRSGAILGLAIWLVVSIWFGASRVFVSVNACGFEAQSGSASPQISLEVAEFLTQQINGGEKNLRALERLVQVNFKDVSTCSVVKKGVNFEVTITPVKVAQNSNKIISPFDCVIKEILVASGEAVVGVGDVVRAGQTLVKSVKFGEKTEPAKAKISAKAYVYGTAYYNENATVFVRTGRTQTSRAIQLFGLTLMPKKPTKFGLNQSQTRIINVSKNSVLPIIVEETTYYELEEQPKFIEFSEVEEKIRQNALELARSKLPSNEIFAQETIAISREGTLVRVDAYLSFDYEF